jgi:hypothetical protein
MKKITLYIIFACLMAIPSAFASFDWHNYNFDGDRILNHTNNYYLDQLTDCNNIKATVIYSDISGPTDHRLYPDDQTDDDFPDYNTSPETEGDTSKGSNEVIPEPMTMLLLGSGLLGMGILRKRTGK